MLTDTVRKINKRAKAESWLYEVWIERVCEAIEEFCEKIEKAEKV